MKHVFVLFTLFLTALGHYHFTHEVHLVNDYPALRFKQKLNHFDIADDRHFEQRYWANYDHWNGVDAPIFLYINGEGMVRGPPSTNSSLVVKLAEKHSGIIVTLEHRFYGESVPFDSLSTSNLQYLTSEQALRDLAEFITWFRNDVRKVVGLPQAQFKIFTIGVSYSGALSAWFRIKYPHITVGSLSSSGVVNAIKDFGQYDGQVSTSVGPQCTSALRMVSKQVQAAINAGQSAALKKRFNATQLNDADFNYMVADIGATMVQYGQQMFLCVPLVDALDKGEKSVMDAFVGVAQNIFFKKFGEVRFYDVNFIADETVEPQRNGRQWWYQTCTEFGWFQTAAPGNQNVRSKAVNVKYFLSFCQQVFGKAFDPQTNVTNEYYGGDHPAGTNIYYANGSQDPWQWASVRSSLSPTEPARVLQCSNCGHGCDVGGCPGGCTPSQPYEDGIKEIIGFVDYWLKL